MMRKKRKNNGSVQGHALLYGRSSRPILIVNGKKVEAVDSQKHTFKKKKKKGTINTVQKTRRISEDTIKKLDKLRDPLEMMGKFARAQKYEASKSSEKYEYGLSDW